MYQAFPAHWQVTNLPHARKATIKAPFAHPILVRTER